MAPQIIIGVDPGTDKFGVAVVAADGRCLWRSVEAAKALEEVMERLGAQYPGALIVIGDGTGSEAFRKRWRESGLGARLGELQIVDERHTTEEARRIYLREHRRGWRRFVPLGLQTPGQPVDGYVAEVLARRYLQALQEGQVR